MTNEEAKAILENEKKCVNRASKNNHCNRDCYNCELVKTDTEILTALEMAIQALESQEDVMRQKMFSFFDGVAEGLKSPLEPTIHIPSYATNGDMIISLYPNLKYYVKDDRIMTTIGVASSFDLEWWNAPYKEDKVDDE